ncbi:MAG: hypothetical protein C0507_18230 [Cyanobacteria bacterium PR.3.49]|nr:hypothetical protein [Cyanobacteria bacterium PR.3.49]
MYWHKQGIITGADVLRKVIFDNAIKSSAGERKVNNQADGNKEELPWFSKPRVLRTVDLRTYGLNTCKTGFAKLWKNGGLGVMAILRADVAREAQQQKTTDEAREETE